MELAMVANLTMPCHPLLVKAFFYESRWQSPKMKKIQTYMSTSSFAFSKNKNKKLHLTKGWYGMKQRSNGLELVLCFRRV